MHQLERFSSSTPFQFTPLREGRLCYMAQILMQQISIHAPPRGATHMARICRTPSSFQFTPLREGRRRTETNFFIVMNFNSRPSARGDRKKVAIRQHDCNFNSRPSARGDSDIKRLYNAFSISIHAPPRGATRTQFPHWSSVNFNSRPSARGDLNSGDATMSAFISIHAPPRGATEADAEVVTA